MLPIATNSIPRPKIVKIRLLMMTIPRWDGKFALKGHESYPNDRFYSTHVFFVGLRLFSVCGMKHVPSLIKTFWIQCESCDSWYHVAEKCIGFGEQQANRDDFQWSCVVCAPDTDSDDEKEIVNNDEARKDCDQHSNPTEYEAPSAESIETEVNNDDGGANQLKPKTVEKETQSSKKPSTPPALRQLKSYNNDGSGNGDRLGYWEDFQTMSVLGNPDRSLRKRQSQAEDPGKTFQVGDLVFVENHAWAYVNNSGGIGFIQKTYLGTDGDRVYDVKYPALDRTEKGIMAEYISPYSFD